LLLVLVLVLVAVMSDAGMGLLDVGGINNACFFLTT
jgi:hypothetical protein